LIHIHVVGLTRVSTGIVARDCDVDRVVQHKGCMNEASIEGAVPAIAGLAAACVDRVPGAPAVA
jgi:hypothetical protein